MIDPATVGGLVIVAIATIISFVFSDLTKRFKWETRMLRDQFDAMTNAQYDVFAEIKKMKKLLHEANVKRAFMQTKSEFVLEFVADELACEKRWEFPKDEPFVEYEPKDEAWCRKLGIGREVLVPLVYQVGNKIITHPSYIETLKKELLNAFRTRRAATSD